ncbi:response regulator transcription factor [Alteromonas pelagimontana]|uniref:Response regulator transcription factor n=1 Tax=Alteromonas pelagimontana TaxID=1858656 RepID=A0A6M4MED8_9ALTE|nr:LuxR C-terminal-related transcriptional regulator [Alteromonas pelagimontana]QJR81469.1 response regulator transcription factor [Alteromonas pelagimontana]
MTRDTSKSSVEERLALLSKRELQVAHKIMEGLPNKTIASQLFISERTVKFHCANIYRKLDIRNRASLMASFFRQLYQPVQHG